MKLSKINTAKFHVLFPVFIVLLAVSCNSLPEGNPPPIEQPIIIDPPQVVIKEPENNNQQEIPPTPVPKFPDSEDAVNYMLTSLATRCRPISSPGKTLPEIFNRFTIAPGNVNDLPMELWQKLIRNKMIKPVSDPNAEYAYSLESKIEVLPTPISEDQKYRWQMKLIQNNMDKNEIWKANFDFVHK